MTLKLAGPTRREWGKFHPQPWIASFPHSLLTAARKCLPPHPTKKKKADHMTSKDSDIISLITMCSPKIPEKMFPNLHHPGEDIISSCSRRVIIRFPAIRLVWAIPTGNQRSTQRIGIPNYQENWVFSAWKKQIDNKQPKNEGSNSQ